MKTLVVVFTYNEAQNIRLLISNILRIEADIEILVVDDDSPDGTEQLIEDLSRNEERIHLLRRTGKRGRGLSGKEGFKYACRSNVDYIIEMDADLSHDPAYIPAFLRHIQDCDVVIGSRNIKGGLDKRKSIIRKVITKLARTLVRRVLNIRITDPTSGYRCFRKKALENTDLDSLSSKGPFIIVDTLDRCVKRHYKIKEIPIEFYPRGSGSTKLNFFILLSSLIKLISLKVPRSILKIGDAK